MQKDHAAKEVKFFDQAGRVFLHPSSVLFAETGLKSGFVTYFSKAETSKVFLRDSTEVRRHLQMLGLPTRLKLNDRSLFSPYSCSAARSLYSTLLAVSCLAKTASSSSERIPELLSSALNYGKSFLGWLDGYFS